MHCMNDRAFHNFWRCKNYTMLWKIQFEIKGLTGLVQDLPRNIMLSKEEKKKTKMRWYNNEIKWTNYKWMTK